jgi:hypothetical protein
LRAAAERVIVRRLIVAMFADEVNPTHAELRAWAAERGAMCPMEDWDLMITAGSENDMVCLELAASDLPNADFFLRCLHIVIGDALRTEWRTRSREEIEGLVAQGAPSANAAVRKWAQAARQVLSRPDTFDAEDWIHGGAVPSDDAV